jgi:acetyl coenzyme A synthetase (ADP forming)-like protein
MSTMIVPSGTPEFGADVLLRNGSTLRLRPVGPGDADAIAGLWAHLSAASRRFRFLAAPPADWMSRLVASDDASAVAVVAEAKGRVVAVATYSRDPRRPDRAEAAFAVADELQGQGVGTRLLEILADVARRHDIRFFDADVLVDNQRMLQVFADSGFATTLDIDAGVIHVSVDLSRTPAAAAQELSRAQVAATASIRPLLEPASVAVVGASRTRGKIGSEILHNLAATGFAGRLYAVHPTARDIDGVPAWPSFGALPEPIDLAVVCVPAMQVQRVVEDAVAHGVRGLTVITAGFSETGEPGRAAEARLLDTVRRAGVRMVGPNCMGVLSTAEGVRLNATFSPVFPPAGNVAMSTQSGALGLAILDYASRLKIGISSFASIGNKADLSSNDLLLYWATDERTDVILLYVESFGNPAKFGQIAHRVARRKPIVVVKAGRSAAGARAASSHTGALASSDTVVDALFRQSGVIRTTTMEEMFDVTRVLATQPLPPGRRAAILTNAGGPGILAADACAAHGLEVPPVSAGTAAALRALLPATAAVGNPVDMIASASAAQYERALSALLADEAVDSVLVIFIPPIVTRGEDVAAAIRRAGASRPDKPVVAIFMSSQPATALLAPIPAFTFPEGAALALARAASYAEWRHAPDGTLPEWTDIDTPAIRGVAARALARGDGWLTAAEVDAMLDAAGIQRVTSGLAASEEEAVAAADTIGYPVALKAQGPDLVHKTEARAVVLNVVDEAAVRDVWRDLTARLGRHMTAILVQPMIRGGAEMLIGAFQDPDFGPVLVCASGGILAELLADRQVRLAPLTHEDAASMVDGLRGAVLLRGHRGAVPLDEGALRNALLRLSALIERCPDIQELDINPLTVLPEGAVALDARIRVAARRPPSPTRRLRL